MMNLSSLGAKTIRISSQMYQEADMNRRFESESYKTWQIGSTITTEKKLIAMMVIHREKLLRMD